MTLTQYIQKKDWEGLYSKFTHMTNSEFRRSESIVRNGLAQLEENDFWDAYLHLVMFRRQSFLSCILSIGTLAAKDALKFDGEEASKLAEWILQNSEDSVAKILKMALPLLKTESQIEGMLHLFKVDDEKMWIDILLKEDTPIAYYMLFKAAKKIDDVETEKKICRTAIKKGNDMAFNMASIMKSYFALEDISSTFSLRIEPYELSYLEQSYENFKNVLTGRRPKV